MRFAWPIERVPRNAVDDESDVEAVAGRWDEEELRVRRVLLRRENDQVKVGLKR